MSRNKKIAIIIPSVCVGLALIILLGLIFTGLYVGWGPFTYLQFDSQERAIVEKYDAEERQGEIVFYGASNFRLWTEMENDLSEYKVQNHGFGGSTDKDLVERAETILYPYAPAVVSSRQARMTISRFRAPMRRRWRHVWNIRSICSPPSTSACPRQRLW